MPVLEQASSHRWRRALIVTAPNHPHPESERAVRQAAWDLYFRDDPVCIPPEFVTDPGIDLDAVLCGQPVLLLAGGVAAAKRRGIPAGASNEDVDARIRELRRITRQSWSNLLKAALSLQGKPHQPFGTGSVQATAQSAIRGMQRETALDFAALERRLTALHP